MSSSSISASDAPARALRRYLALLALGTLGCVAAFLGLVAASHGVRIDTPPSAVAARLLAKMERAAAIDGRRILIFAGSQGFYNLRAERLEEATGLPAVNLSTHGAQSLPFLLWQVEQVARPGDVVLLPLEHSFYRDAGLTTYGVEIAHAAGLPLFTALPFGERLQYLRELRLPDLMRALATRLGLIAGLEEDGLALDVTPHGDVVSPRQDRDQLEAAIAKLGPRHPRLGPLTAEAARPIGAFLDRMAAREVAVVFLPPGIMEPAQPTPAERRRLAGSLEKIDGLFLDLWNGGGIPAEAMLDTIYHAAGSGAALYTASVIVALCEALEGLPCAPEQLSAARGTIGSLDRHGIVLGDDPRLARLRHGEIDLPADERIAFSVATFTHCRSRLEIVAQGPLELSAGGVPQALEPDSDGVLRAELPRRRGLLDLTLRAGGNGARLTRLGRASDCETAPID